MAASPLPPFSPVLLGPDPREPNANAGKGYDTAEKVAALRKVLDVDGSPEHHRAHLSTVSLRRYLRARQGDVEKAAELARGSLRERVDESTGFGEGLGGAGGDAAGRVGGRGGCACRRV